MFKRRRTGTVRSGGHGSAEEQRCELSKARELLCILEVVILALYGFIKTCQKYKETSSMDYRERGSHARGVYATQYTPRMGTAKVKEEEEANKRIIVNA